MAVITDTVHLANFFYFKPTLESSKLCSWNSLELYKIMKVTWQHAVKA